MTNDSSVKNQDTWHAIAHIYDVLIVMSMVTLQLIAKTKYHHQAHWPTIRSITLIQGIILGLLLDIITGTDTGSADLDPGHTLTDIKATATTTHTEVTPDLITDILMGAHHVINTPVLIVIKVTHHTEGHHHIEVPQLIPETAADLDHILHTDPVEWHLLNLHPVLAKQYENIRIGNIKESPLMTPSLTTTAWMMHPVIPMMI